MFPVHRLFLYDVILVVKYHIYFYDYELYKYLGMVNNTCIECDYGKHCNDYENEW